MPVDGWCYVDASAMPSVGNADLVAACPATDKRTLRFVGEGKPQSGESVMLVCSGG